MNSSLVSGSVLETAVVMCWEVKQRRPLGREKAGDHPVPEEDAVLGLRMRISDTPTPTPAHASWWSWLKHFTAPALGTTRCRKSGGGCHAVTASPSNTCRWEACGGHCRTFRKNQEVWLDGRGAHYASTVLFSQFSHWLAVLQKALSESPSLISLSAT